MRARPLNPTVNKVKRKNKDKITILSAHEDLKCWTQPWHVGVKQVGTITRSGAGFAVETFEAGSRERYTEEYDQIDDLVEKWTVTP